MDQATCEPRIYPPERKRTRTIIGLVGVAGVAGMGVAMIAASILVPNNNRQGDKLIAAATDLAHNRNTCRIKTTQVTKELGKPAVQVTIDLTTKTKPASLENRYDRFGMNVTFKDILKNNTGTLVSGVSVANDTAAKAVFVSAEGIGPDTGVSTITIPQEVISKGRANYTISMQNAVEVTRSGWLVNDGARMEMGRIPCGQFAFQPDPPSLAG